MKAFNSATNASLGNRRASKRNLLRLDLAEGTFGFCGDSGDLTYEGVVYRGCGKYISINNLDGASDFSVSPIEVRLSTIPDSRLTPDVLATFNAYTWHQRPAVLYDAYIHPDTRELISVERIARRLIDTCDFLEHVGGQAVLVALLQPLNYDNTARGYMRYSDADQRLIDPDDGYFSFAAKAGTANISWGRKEETPAAGAAGTSGV